MRMRTRRRACLSACICPAYGRVLVTGVRRGVTQYAGKASRSSRQGRAVRALPVVQVTVNQRALARIPGALTTSHRCKTISFLSEQLSRRATRLSGRARSNLANIASGIPFCAAGRLMGLILTTITSFRRMIISKHPCASRFAALEPGNFSARLLDLTADERTIQRVSRPSFRIASMPS